ADLVNLINRNGLVDRQISPPRFDPALAKSYVVILVASRIGSSFENHDGIWILSKSSCNLIQHIRVFFVQLGTVKLELDGFFFIHVVRIPVRELLIKRADIVYCPLGGRASLTRALINVGYFRLQPVEAFGRLRIEG